MNSKQTECYIPIIIIVPYTSGKNWIFSNMYSWIGFYVRPGSSLNAFPNHQHSNCLTPCGKKSTSCVYVFFTTLVLAQMSPTLLLLGLLDAFTKATNPKHHTISIKSANLLFVACENVIFPPSELSTLMPNKFLARVLISLQLYIQCWFSPQ